MSKRWRRNQRLKCECLGYWFPHRRGGGLCHTSKTRTYHLARRAGESHVDAGIELTFTHPVMADPAVIPF